MWHHDEMQTKYVRSSDGYFVIFNEGIGSQHADMACYLGMLRRVSDAGFVQIDEGRFKVYGRSLGLNLSCDPFAADAMNEALQQRKLRLHKFLDLGFIVTNGDLDGADGSVVHTLDQLATNRIFLRE
jgi:hypothetical protein